jgi:hypothetical protein
MPSSSVLSEDEKESQPFRHTCNSGLQPLPLRRTIMKIQWLRVLLGGFLAEVAVFAAVIPVFRIAGQHALLYAAPVASLVMCFLFGLGVARGIESRFVLHGALVGVVATLLYVAITLGHPEPFAYLVAHVLKILGGAAGGALAAARAKTQAPSPVGP